MQELMKLPFKKGDLKPFISKKTIKHHYKKHHAGYVKKLNTLIHDTPYETMSLEKIVLQSDGAIFNNAAQVYNHNLYWLGLSNRPSHRSEVLKKAIVEAYTSFGHFKTAFFEEALSLFGAGWVWLTLSPKGSLMIEKTSNADTPLRHGYAAFGMRSLGTCLLS